ncbi:formaldehyde-activating enzyme [Halomonas sp. NCCP-2165]|nr:formaldehyde-activating enzyme [Halomonas sp. NCCP-2165]GKW47935.1 aldehyde-activating protein [Halomonas sp. NCCP-2165]
MKAMNMYIGEGFEGPGVNAAHINILIGPKDGPVGNAWAGSITSPTRGHSPFMVIAQPNVPVKPVTLFTNKAEIEGELHGKATWGAAQAGIAKAVTEALLDGTLPEEAAEEWCILTANWVNPACDDLDAVYANNYRACTNAIKAALQGTPNKQDLELAVGSISNPFYSVKN